MKILSDNYVKMIKMSHQLTREGNSNTLVVILMRENYTDIDS